MADGSLRIEVEVEPQDAQEAFALFGKPGAPMALAALAVGHAAAKDEPDKPKGGERAKWCALRCQEPEFQQFLKAAFPLAWSHGIGDTDVHRAASVIRAVCLIETRIELDNDKVSAMRFDKLIRMPWLERKT